MNPRKNETGQAIVIMVVFLVVFMACAAFVLDVGAWYRTDRRLQQTADAAALAGAQELPGNPTLAKVTAFDYAQRNGGNVDLSDIKVISTVNPNDTISVKAEKEEPGSFSKVLGIDKTKISASAKARVDVPLKAKYAAPMVIHCNHPLIKKCNQSMNTPKFFEPTVLKYDPMGAPGAFGMLNLSDKQGTPGTSEEADWILRGFDQWMDVGRDYKSDPGAKFSSQEIQGALQTRLEQGVPLLFPVYETLKGQGQNATYFIIGWIGFVVTGYQVAGNNAILEGYFTEYIAHGYFTSSGSTTPNLGVKSIQLVE